VRAGGSATTALGTQSMGLTGLWSLPHGSSLFGTTTICSHSGHCSICRLRPPALHSLIASVNQRECGAVRADTHASRPAVLEYVFADALQVTLEDVLLKIVPELVRDFTSTTSAFVARLSPAVAPAVVVPLRRRPLSVLDAA
jgi:hypothetical protein